MRTKLRFFSFQSESAPEIGARIEDGFVNLTQAGLPNTLEGLLSLGKEGLSHAQKIVAQAKTRHSLEGLSLLPPITNPSKAIAVGLNYVDHATETKFDPPVFPVLFPRYRSSWVGHGHDLIKPTLSEQFDYEGELVVVIGKPGYKIEKESALDHVAGYSIFNDGSIRDYQFKTPQWLVGKNFDCTGSFGPELVTPDELPPGADGLRLQTSLNGRVVQDANTRDMIFDVATLISICSASFALATGDIIISGTPSGIGFARSPQLFMKAGDVCRVHIDGIGALSNPVRDEVPRGG